jgi:hypothetical protein
VARLWAVAVTLPKVKPKASSSERCPPIRYKGVVKTTRFEFCSKIRSHFLD